MVAVKETLIQGAPVVLQFSFPRVGGHFLTHCIRALYDTDPDPASANGGIIWPSQSPSAARGDILPPPAENADRDNEINPLSRYALTLRDTPGALCQLNLIHGRTGMHGAPGDIRPGEFAVVIIRDPIATIYSLYRVMRDRWSPETPFDASSVHHHLTQYQLFYQTAFDLKQRFYYNLKIVRYERLTESPEELRSFCNFLGIRPKLEPEFVWHITKFENFAAAGPRSFYRQGDNNAWRADSAFCRLLGPSADLDFTPFGYAPVAACGGVL